MYNYFETRNFHLVENTMLCACVSKISVYDTYLLLFTEKTTTFAISIKQIPPFLKQYSCQQKF